jgi:FAD/FMN-containing dehydrogenase
MEAPSPRRHPSRASDVAALAASLHGEAILPGDVSYDEARTSHNPVLDRRPVVVVRPADASDVAKTVLFARETGLDLAIRSGGHSLAGHSTTDGGVLLDLRSMRALHIDPEARLAWAQPGLTAGDVTNALAEHGLAVPFGDTSTVGIGGITLGGGIGFLARKYGLTIDNLASAEVVLADGRIVTASETQHPDLFWAIRGGGGNFGVVTRFQYRLQPVGVVVGGALALPPTREVIRGVIQAAKEAPEELTMIAFLMPLPPAPFVPAEAVGQLALVVMPVVVGDAEAGQAAMAPFRAIAAPLADVVGPMPYPVIYQFTAGGEAPHASVTRSMFTANLDDDAIDRILEGMAKAASPASFVQLRVLGGAVAAVPADATAFAIRDQDVLLAFIAMYETEEQQPAVEAWAADLFEALRPKAGGVYSNFLEDEGDARIREAYPGGTYERLAEIKRRYDPTNVFRLNQNIRPAPVAAVG